jgi:hypothetical protein
VLFSAEFSQMKTPFSSPELTQYSRSQIRTERRKSWPIGARRWLAPIGPPLAFWLKNTYVWLLFFELRPRRIFDPHWAGYLGCTSVSVGFWFRLVRYSGNLLSSRYATVL